MIIFTLRFPVHNVNHGLIDPSVEFHEDQTQDHPHEDPAPICKKQWNETYKKIKILTN